MIKYYNRSELDLEKYDVCISNSTNSRVYAFSWYLDSVCDSWGALVMKDYAAVMPLPKRIKFGVNYIYLPSWSQQLGVFSLEKEQTPPLMDFIKCIPKKFKLIEIFLNAETQPGSVRVKVRKNFILPMNQAYETLFKAFSKGRKSSVKLGIKQDLKVFDQCEYKKIVQLFKENKGLQLNDVPMSYKSFENLISKAGEKNILISMGVKNAGEKLIGGAIFLISKNRITYLFSAIDKEGREKQAMSYLLNEIIKKYAGSAFILDFEGSMLPGPASFFKSFGALEENYFHFKKYRL